MNFEERLKEMKKKNPIVKISKSKQKNIKKSVFSKSEVFNEDLELKKVLKLKVSKIDSDSENHEIEDCVNPLDE